MLLHALAVLTTLLPTAHQEPNPTFTVHDSAGVRIVESSKPQLAPGTWTVSPEPVLEIGELEGDEHYLFQNIPKLGLYLRGGAVRLAGGEIAVCDNGPLSVRIFDQDGRFVREFGRLGEGPGEFRSRIQACDRLGAGIAVLERREASLFDAEGSFVRKIRATIPGAFQIDGLYPDGSVLVQTVSNSVDRTPGPFVPTGHLLIQGPDGEPSEWAVPVQLYSMLGFRMSGGVATAAQPFAPVGVVATTPGGFVYGWSSSCELRLFNRSGQLTRVVRAALDPVPVTKQERADTSFGMPPELARISTQYAVEHYAPFNRVLVDRLQYLWIRRIHPDTSWDVFGPDGQWATTVTLPEGVVINDIGEDYVLGVWKDEMDVQYVRMYRLER